MIDVHSGCAEKVGTVGGLIRANGLDIERARALRNIVQEISAPARRQDRMPNGDPPSLMLWGTEEEK